MLTEKNLPIINGRRINAIYARGFFADGKSCDAAVAGKIDYYLCTTDDKDYEASRKQEGWPKRDYIKKPDVKLKTLPDIFKPIFKKSNSIWFSHEIMGRMKKIYVGNKTFYCGEEGSDKQLHECELGKNVLAILNQNIEVEELDWFYDIKFDQTHLRREGDFWYPDTALESWRWSHGQPYVSAEYGDKKHIRVYDEILNAHLFLEREDELYVGQEQLVRVHFSRYYEKNRDFCIIDRWAHTKQGAPNEIIRYKVLDLSEDWWPVKIGAMLNDVVQCTQQTCLGVYYKVNRINYVN